MVAESICTSISCLTELEVMQSRTIKRLVRLARRALVVQKRCEGMSIQEINQKFGVPYTTVWRWLREWKYDVMLYQELLEHQWRNNVYTSVIHNILQPPTEAASVSDHFHNMHYKSHLQDCRMACMYWSNYQRNFSNYMH